MFAERNCGKDAAGTNASSGAFDMVNAWVGILHMLVSITLLVLAITIWGWTNESKQMRAENESHHFKIHGIRYCHRLFDRGYSFANAEVGKQCLAFLTQASHKRQAWAERQIDWCVPGAILQWDDAAHIPTCTIPNKD